MRTVKIRLFVEVCRDGIINYIEEPITYSEGEEFCGFKLDKRKNYCIVEGKMCESIEWSQECSGCDGGGCSECGYHGRSAKGMWYPV